MEMKELKEAIIEKTDMRGDHGALVALKVSWALATQQFDEDRKTVPNAPAAPAVVIDEDEALSPEDQKKLMDTSSLYYRYKRVVPDKMGSDSMLGKISREFAVRKPKLLAIAMAKSLAAANRHRPAKRERWGDRVTVTVDGDEHEEEEDFQWHPLAAWVRKLHLFMTTWTHAGCFDVPHEGKTVKYVHRCDAEEYCENITKRLWKFANTFTDDSIIALVTAIEEEFRTYAIGTVRTDPSVPWGFALLDAAKSNAHLWQEKKELLRRVQTQERGAPWQISPMARAPRGQRRTKGKGGKGGGSAPPPAKGGKAKNKGAGKGRGDGRGKSLNTHWKTSNSTSYNNSICSLFNDARGCRGAHCPKKEEHCCNVILTSGWVCQDTRHGELQHAERTDGEAATRF